MRIPMPAAVLAGGASRRMGRPKAELPYGAGTLLEFQVSRLAELSRRCRRRKEPPASPLAPGPRRPRPVPQHAAIHGLRASRKRTIALRARGGPAGDRAGVAAGDCRRSLATTRPALVPRARAPAALAAVWRRSVLRRRGEDRAGRCRCEGWRRRSGRSARRDGLARIRPLGRGLHQPEHARAMPHRGRGHERNRKPARGKPRRPRAAAAAPERSRERAGAAWWTSVRRAPRGEWPSRGAVGMGKAAFDALPAAGSPRATMAVARLAGIQAASGRPRSSRSATRSPSSRSRWTLRWSGAARGASSRDGADHRQDRSRDGGAHCRRRGVPASIYDMVRPWTRRR